MDEIQSVLVSIAEGAPVVALVLGILGSLVVLGQAVVLLTPSKKDDELLASLEKRSVIKFFLDLIKRFAVIQKK